MEIRNAKIKNVTVDFFNAQYFGARLKLETKDSSEIISLNLCNFYEIQLFKKIREYTEAEKIDEMKGKIIRLVYFNDIRQAFGDPIHDKFINFKKEVNESEIIKELSESDLKAKVSH